MANSAQSTEFSIYADESVVAALSNRKLKSASGPTDLEIIISAQGGSTSAFDELQRRYSSRLYRTILRIMKNREDAEDVLQETFLRAYMALDRFERRSSAYSWLTRIAINTSLMILRRRRARPEGSLLPSPEREDEYPQVEIKDTAPNPEESYELRQRNRILEEAIQKLGPMLRTPIEIQLCDEHSVKEIANILNASVAAVKARLYRARSHLVKRVSKHSEAKT